MNPWVWVTHGIHEHWYPHKQWWFRKNLFWHCVFTVYKCNESFIAVDDNSIMIFTPVIGSSFVIRALYIHLQTCQIPEVFIRNPRRGFRSWEHWYGAFQSFSAHIALCRQVYVYEAFCSAYARLYLFYSINNVVFVLNVRSCY